MAGRRHLTDAEATASLRRGRQVEQLLLADGAEVHWVTLWTSGQVNLHRVEDLGHAEFRDVAEFPPLDQDEHVGEGIEVARCDTFAESIEAAKGVGCQADRWVNSGMVGDDYADARGFR